MVDELVDAPGRGRARSTVRWSAPFGSSRPHSQYRRSLATRSCASSVRRSISSSSTGTPAAGARTTRSARCT
ncbi:hypothetical protein ACFXKG_33005 [Streptomyces sp. NPDC059255]|uniref:hypothetical protein n=1 Tax=Streptomyces sp. NPDC059255 TaxID=3346793 RepID=UPI0036AD0A7E